MIRRVVLLAAVAAAYLTGIQIASGKHEDLLKELAHRQQWLFKDILKIERACKDIVEIAEMRESGKYVLNAEEKKMEKKARMDFHIFMERFRNDTLETLAIYERVLNKQDYVDPLERAFGKALKANVAVKWDEEDIEEVIGEISHAYSVQINLSGDMDYRKTVSLNGEMSLLSILLYLENALDAKIVMKEGELWFVKAPPPKAKKAEASEDK